MWRVRISISHLTLGEIPTMLCWMGSPGMLPGTAERPGNGIPHPPPPSADPRQRQEDTIRSSGGRGGNLRVTGSSSGFAFYFPQASGRALLPELQLAGVSWGGNPKAGVLPYLRGKQSQGEPAKDLGTTGCSTRDSGTRLAFGELSLQPGDQPPVTCCRTSGFCCIKCNSLWPAWAASLYRSGFLPSFAMSLKR